MRRKIGTACIILGAALVLAALSLLLYNRREDVRAGRSAQLLLPRIEEQAEAARAGRAAGTAEAALPDPYDPAMTEVEIDGYLYVGYVSVPALELELPVMSEWDYTRLKIAPCRYAGSTKTDDLVICAHNYDRHFGRLKNLSPGDEVYFTDMDGVVTAYTVAAVEVLRPTAVADMTAGDYDLTLFTCTYGGATRVTVRCARAA